MKCLIVFVSICLLQSQVQARTIEDVIVDFQPIFDEIHDKISSDQTHSHAEGNKRLGEIRGLMSQSAWSNQKSLEMALYDIRDQIRQILGETGMIAHDDLVKHCFTKEQMETVFLNRETSSGNGICTVLGNKVIDDLNIILNSLYNKQANMHQYVESSKSVCKETSKTPLEMQTCMIENLYLRYKPAVKDLEIEVKKVIKDIDEMMKTITDDLNLCFAIVGKNTMEHRVPIIDSYRKCVIEASKNVNKS